MEKIKKIKNSIEAIISLSDDELALFNTAFTAKVYKKDTYFLREGEICDYIGFVNSGVLIYAKTKENGDEVTTDFAFEGDWVNNNQSRLNNAPSSILIKAIADSELLVIPQKTLNQLYLQIPKIERLGRILMEQAYLKIAEKSIDLQVLSAKERYENLLMNYPTIFQRVQLYHIANYLGVAPKSLSRIRKEIFE